MIRRWRPRTQSLNYLEKKFGDDRLLTGHVRRIDAVGPLLLLAVTGESIYDLAQDLSLADHYPAKNRYRTAVNHQLSQFQEERARHRCLQKSKARTRRAEL